MNTFFHRWMRGFVALLIAVLGACATGPQTPTIRLELAAREVPNSEMRWQQVDPAAGGVRVWRGAQELRATVGMLLQMGDIVETGPAVAAVIRFRPAGTTVLDTSTRVRIGSLEVVFGRVFANVRGFFRTSSDTVLAGVSGTRYLFQVRADRQTRVSVLDGEVTCAPRQGGWTPVPLRAGQELVVGTGSRGAVPVTPADPRELRDAAEWANQVTQAGVEGLCCVAPGRIERTWNNRCSSGRFSTSASIAESLCRPEPADPIGYCCNDGAVQPMRRSQCQGAWNENESALRRSCGYRPPPVSVPEPRPVPPAQPAPLPRPVPAPTPAPPPPRPPVIR